MVAFPLRKILEVPQEYAKQNRSTGCLLEDVGFPEARGLLKEQDVEKLLREEPHLVDLWLKRGKDQRYSGGWGIECLKGKYRVVSYADGHKRPWGTDRFKACAEFVVCYLLFIGEVQTRYGREKRRARNQRALAQ